MKTILALYDNGTDAHSVVEALRDAGFSNEQVSVVAHRGEYDDYIDDAGNVSYDDEDVDAGEGATVGAIEGGLIGLLAGLGAMAIPGIGPIVAAGPLLGALTGAATGAVTGGVVAALVDAGVSEEDAGHYAEGVRRGGTMVTVHADDSRADEAAAIMNRYHPVDLNSRADQWREEGWTGYDHEEEWYDTDAIATERERYADRSTNYVTDRDVEGEQVLPVVEEELRVGKRTVQRGGVRIHSEIEEIPVEEQVSVREEHVHVERRPVNRDATDADLDDATLVDGVLEVTESAEEVIVDKRARVIEEIVVSKDVDTRTETIRDTVRRTDVEVEQLEGEQVVDRDYGTFESYEANYRTDYDSRYADADYEWEHYRPAYQYGYNLATHNRYQSREWADVEPDARSYWEERNEGTWEEFKDAVQHGWNEVKQEASEHI